MTPKLYLFIPNRKTEDTHLESLVLTWVYTDVNNDLKIAQGNLDDAAKLIQNHYVTIVVPGEDVLFLTAEVPGTNIQRIQQAVPYVLEDSVVDDVDNLIFAISKKNEGNNYNVSIIDKKYLELIVNQLAAADIHADAMNADYFLLPDNHVLFTNEKRVLCNSLKHKFATSDEKLANKLLEENSSLQEIHCEKENIDNEFNSDGYELCLIKHGSSENSINLLQGRYKKKKNWSQTTKIWLPVAALFLVWVSLQGGLFIVDYVGLSKKNTLLNAEITKIYKKAFPESRRVIDAKAQMQQQLTSLKKRRGKSGRSFTEMLSNSASVFAKSKGLNIKSLRYYDGRINLEIKIASLQALDKLKEQLKIENGYNVEIQNASSGKEFVTARIQIIGAES